MSAYTIPSLAECLARPDTGYRVASLFSGMGGSSLGYRMAGFRVVYANEFVEAARDTYRANFPTTPVDPRDIRVVTGADVLQTAQLTRGALDVLDGSPPCASFSSAGKLEAHWGKAKKYSDTTQRTDDLFFEYLRLVDEIRPRVCIAENVAGLVRGVGKGLFKQILARFAALDYRVAAQLLDAQWLGVPQRRQRVIFVAVRRDLNVAPAHPLPLSSRVSIRDALSLPSSATTLHTFHGEQRLDAPAPTVLTHNRGRNVMSVVTALQDTVWHARWLPASQPAPAITTAPTHCMEHGRSRRLTIAELKRLCSVPDDFTLTGTYAQQWERLGRAVPPAMMHAIAATVRDRILDVARARQEQSA